MSISWDMVLRYVPEVALVIIFMVYEERRNTRTEKVETERTHIREKAETERQESWQKFLTIEREERGRMWKEFESQLDHLVKTAHHELEGTRGPWNGKIQ